MRFVSYVLVALGSAALTAWMYNGGHFVGPSRALSPPTFEFSYSDFVSVLLTPLALVLAALAIVIGLIAFRTIGEIKREAGRIAEEHSKSEVENSLASVPETVAKAVEGEVRERLPAAIDQALEIAGKAGLLDEALQKVIMQISTGGGMMHSELQPEFEQPKREDDTNA